MSENLSEWMALATEYGLPLLIALGILVLGWLFAVIAAATVRGLLGRTKIDEKIAGVFADEGEKPPPVSAWIATGVKWLILLFTLVAVVDKLELPAAATPINALLGEVLEYLPRIVGAGILLVLAWLVASVLRRIVTGALTRVKIDERLQSAAGEDAPPVSIAKSLGTAVYWLVFLVFMLLILGTLQLDGLLTPLQEMVDKALGYVPNIFAALAILALGWFGATIVRRIVTSLLAALGIDRIADKTGVSGVGKGTVSGLLGTVTFLLILLPVITMSLEALDMESVSRPISGLIDTFVQAIPNLLYAALIVTVAWIVGKLVAGLASDLLARIGFDRILLKLGLSKTAPEDIGEKARPSAVVGQLVMLAVMLFATLEALDKLELTQVAELLSRFIGLAGQWIFGLFIFGLALWLANLVSEIIRDRGTKSSGLLSSAARIGITVLGGIMALTEMGIAEEVVTKSVLIAVAAVGLACGLAFGLGCKEQASRQLDDWRGRIDESLGGGDDAWPS